LTIVTRSPEETQQLGAQLGRLLQPGDVVLLQGEIGAGKTCFTQGLAVGMGLTSRVTSPSFTLANVYQPGKGGFPLYHLDLWRIKSPLEALGIGLEEYLAGHAASVIEWPDVATDVLPDEHLRIRFTAEGDARRIAIDAVGSRPTEILAELRSGLAQRAHPAGGGDAARD
jgi:tRNA threonylcarbamoyladenosine biosynthesis protein TsaE